MSCFLKVNLSQQVLFDFQSKMIPILSILVGQAQTLHIPCDTIPPSLPWTSPLPGSRNLHLHTKLQCLSHAVSSLCSTCPNHCNLLLLTDKLTGPGPNNALISIIFLLSFKLKPSHSYLTLLHVPQSLAKSSYRKSNYFLCNLMQMHPTFNIIAKLIHGYIITQIH